MMNIQKFNINFDESRFADLRKRIAATRWPEGASFNGWQYGTPIDVLRHFTAMEAPEPFTEALRKFIGTLPNHI